MSKQVTLTRESQIEEFKDTLRASAEETHLRIAELVGKADPLEFLFQLKFNRLGRDPLNPARELNFVEQLNQTFTTSHPSARPSSYLNGTLLFKD